MVTSVNISQILILGTLTVPLDWVFGLNGLGVTTAVLSSKGAAA